MRSFIAFFRPRRGRHTHKAVAARLAGDKVHTEPAPAAEGPGLHLVADDGADTVVIDRHQVLTAIRAG